MKLRIITGFLKNRSIKVKDTGMSFRPTKEVVREAVADIVMEKIDGALIADLCAGSGALGFEMLSRGAKQVHFVDNSRMCCHNIIKHARLFNVEDQSLVFCKDIRGYLRSCTDTFNIIYYDPPYTNLILAEIIPNILPFVSKNGILIFERRKRKHSETPYQGDDFNLETRKYGDTVLTIFYRIRNNDIYSKQRDA